MNKKFDFSEIDGALPTAEKMQEQDRIIDALKNNYEGSPAQNGRGCFFPAWGKHGHTRRGSEKDA